MIRSDSSLQTRRRLATYWMTGIGFVLVLAALHGSKWRGSADLHTHMEIIATVLAAVVGALALVRFYSKKDSTFLFIGSGFLGTAFLDGYHAIVTSELFLTSMPSDLPSLAPWSWFASRLFLSVMVFLSLVVWKREQRLGSDGRIPERKVYLFTGAFTLLSFLFFAFTPLPKAYFPQIELHRPEELLPAFFFLVALAGYLKKGHWKHNDFEHWLVLSLIIGFVGQAVFLSHSEQIFDYEFDVSHLLKKASYVCVLAGLMANMFAIFRRAEDSETQFSDAVQSLQESFALYDAQDRLVVYNDEFLRLHAGLGDIIKPGMTFEELLRESTKRGTIKDAIGREEKHIKNRLKQHRNPVGPILRELTDGTWYIINEARTPEGGIAVTQTDITELKGAEAALRESQELTQRMLEASPVGVLIVTKDGHHLFANERALEIQGVTREQLFSAEAGEFYADPEVRRKMKEELYQTRFTPPTEVELLKPNGEHYFVILSSTLTEFAGQKAHLTYLYDITELKLTQENLRTARDLLVDAMESIDGGVALFDHDDRLLLFNKKYEELLPAIASIMKPGVTFERMLRKLVGSGQYLHEDAEKEQFIEMRLKRHRQAEGVEAYQLADGRWLQIDEYRTHEGGILLIAHDVTDRKQAEQKLLESEARLKAIVDNVPAIITVKDTQSRYLLSNRFHKEFFGYTDEDLAGKTPDIHSPDHGKTMKDYERQVMKSGKALPFFDYEMADKNGKICKLMVAKAPLKDLSGKVIGTITAAFDITDRKQAEEALRENEIRLKAILDTVPALINVKDPDGRYVMSNHYHSDFIGVDGDALIGQTSSVISQEHGKYADNLDREIVKTGEAVAPYDYKLKDAEGRERYFLTIKNPLKNLSNKVTGVVSTSIDITERKRTEEALRESEARTRAIVENVVDSIITIDERGTIQTINPATKQIFGYSEKELVGQNIRLLAAEPYRSAHDRYLANYLTTGEKKIIGKIREVEGQRKNGERFPLTLAVSELILGDEKMFVGIVRDISVRKEMDRLKGEFVSTVSHELRTPLTSIRGSLGLISGGAVGKISKKAASMIDMAEKNTERLITLVNDILDMEKIETGSLEFRFQPLNLGELVNLSVKANKGFADEYGVEFVMTDNFPELKVRGDHDRLLQVVTNLLSNAAKFSPTGEKVEIDLSKQNGSAKVSVTDHRPGIPEDFRRRIFARFTQADSSDTRKASGTGLGLNISKSIIEKHDGTIGFVTEVNAGSTFFFELPLLDEHVEN